MLQLPGSILDMINGLTVIVPSFIVAHSVFRQLADPQRLKSTIDSSFSLSGAGNLGMLFAEAKTK
jgi:hypothetical protein